jgi:hypothetical protein
MKMRVFGLLGLLILLFAWTAPARADTTTNAFPESVREMTPDQLRAYWNSLPQADKNRIYQRRLVLMRQDKKLDIRMAKRTGVMIDPFHNTYMDEEFTNSYMVNGGASYTRAPAQTAENRAIYAEYYARLRKRENLDTTLANANARLDRVQGRNKSRLDRTLGR